MSVLGSAICPKPLTRNSRQSFTPFESPRITFRQSAFARRPITRILWFAIGKLSLNQAECAYCSAVELAFSNYRVQNWCKLVLVVPIRQYPLASQFTHFASPLSVFAKPSECNSNGCRIRWIT